VSVAVVAATVTAGLSVAPAGAEGAGAEPVGGPRYTVEDLGAANVGGFDSYGTGINASGQVSGQARVPIAGGGTAYHAVRWSGTAMTDLGDFGCGAEGRAIADDGTVAGVSNVTCAAYDVHAFHSTPEGIADIGALIPGGVPTRANAINAGGQVVGSSQDNRGLEAFVTDPFALGMRSINSLLPPTPTGFQPNAIEADGIDTQGDVVGYGYTGPECGGHLGPFVYRGDGQLQAVPGPAHEECFGGVARAINDSGVIVGDGGVYGVAPYRAFRSQAGVTEDIGAALLPTLGISLGLGVNAAGDAVGWAKACNICFENAWVDAAPGGMRLLDDLVDPALGWNFREATGINAAGQITGNGAINGVIHAFRLTPVAPVTLSSVAVTPAAPTLQKGATQAFTATGTFSDGSTADLSNRVSWSSSDTTVATISPAGLASALAPGTTTISATTVSASASTTVTVAVPTLSSIAVTPAGATIRPGASQAFTATGTFSDGSTAGLTTVTWSSSDTSVATVSSGGKVKAVRVGTATITATKGPLSGSATLTVANPATLSSITVTPANASLARGTTQKFTATGTYSDGSTADLSAKVAWSSSDRSVATIASGGRAKAIGLGTTTITATAGSLSGSAALTVRPRGTVTGA